MLSIARTVAMSARLSACLSHAGILPERLYIIIKLFTHGVATMSWFFRTKTVRNIPTGTPNGGVECKGYEKIAKLQWLTNIKSHVVYRMAPYSMTLKSLTQLSKSRHSLTLHISETVRDADIVTAKN